MINTKNCFYQLCCFFTRKLDDRPIMWDYLSKILLLNHSVVWSIFSNVRNFTFGLCSIVPSSTVTLVSPSRKVPSSRKSLFLEDVSPNL